MSKKLPKLPNLLNRKIYKTGQTRGADDDVIYQNRVNRNNTVLFPLDYFDICSVAPDNDGVFDNGFIVLINPEEYFSNSEIKDFMKERDIVIGNNALLFYQTRRQWNNFNPVEKDLTPATSRTNPLGGEYVARVPSTTAEDDKRITHGFNTSGLKGAGIRVYEYASGNLNKLCRTQLEFLYWHCPDSIDVIVEAGMSLEDAQIKKEASLKKCNKLNLDNYDLLLEKRIIDKNKDTVCPLCLEKLSANGFLKRLLQAEGREVPDLTVTEVNLFHIVELRMGQFNHKPYNLGWGHHHCNVVCRDAGIADTLRWMESVVNKNNS